MKRTRTAALSLSLTALLALTACGSDDSGSPEASATPTPDRTTCPTTATEVPAFAGVVAANQDLAVKPKLVKGPTPVPTAVTYFDIVEGTGDQAETGSYVKLKYVGAFYKDAKEFDSSWKTSATSSIDVRTCYDGTVTGFAIAPTGMKVGGRRQVNIPAAFGYGAAGRDGIPKNADLIFVIDLVAASVTPFPVDPVPTAEPTSVPPVSSATPSAPTAPPTTPPASTAPAATTAPAGTPRP